MNKFFNQNIPVFKFGGASVKDADGIRNLQKIVMRYSGKPLFVVISAMGKTTNLLEKLLDAYFYGQEDPFVYFNKLRDNHFNVAHQLTEQNERIIAKLTSVLNQLEEKLHTPHSDNYEYEYDQIVSFGEILSTKLISTYLNIVGIRNQWLDARQVMITDSTFMEAKIDWEASEQALKQAIDAATAKKEENLFIIQGFIAGDKQGNATTFGREGSDYSAAIIAYILQAESVTIWKDVPGLLNADPKFFPEAVKLDAISYEEAIELSYYGATIIHPKTLKPLQNKHIPLYVKSFFHPENEGSVITNCRLSTDVPSYIVKDNQVLLTLFPKDFSFMGVENLSNIFAMLAHYRIKINMMQNSALSFSICTDNVGNRLKKCIAELRKFYKVKYNDPVQLITIRHHTPEAVEKAVGNKKVLMRQTSRATMQFVVL